MKEIYANCTDDERRVAILEDGRLTDFFIERFGGENVVGNIYKGKIVSVLKGIQAVFVDIGVSKNGYLPISEITINKSELVKGKNIMVQVTKGPLGTKGAKLTQNISLPGRYLVFMPGTSHIGVSKNITDEKERSRLKSIIGEIKSTAGGFIVRSEGAGKDKNYFRKEIKYHERLWGNISRKFNSVNNVSIIHRDFGLIFKTVRDYLSDDVSVFLIDSEDEYEDILNFVDIVSPKFVNKIRFYRGKTPIFEINKIEQQVENIRKQKIPLPSGGYIIIQEAETLCAIDVNTGKFTRAGSIDEIILKTNMEAISEIAVQLRLRNIGGIIVIDLIDMRKAGDRNKVFKLLVELVKKDKAKTEVLPVTKLGLIEMTRQRKNESIINFLTEPCPYCSGTGNVYSSETMAIKIKKEILKLVTRSGEHHVRVIVHPDIAKILDREFITKIETRISRKIIVDTDSSIHHEDYKITVGS